ncbi:MAG: tRNA 4-thiouridine(8) synthase ThiI [Lentisphaeria bacterium]|nr:tRNA 4-thiouridine(8) synthase ThiI [Lentisphaeria bacterium]
MELSMYNCVICRYHEIATKGNNRNMFERCLCGNIKHLLADIPDIQVRRVRGRVWVERSDKGVFPSETLERIKVALRRAFGLESFSPAILLAPDMDVIRETVVSNAQKIFDGYSSGVKFRVRARRSNKRFPLTSKDIEIDLVSAVAQVVGSDLFIIDLDNADITLGVEVRDEFSLIYFDTYSAPGGLPVGSNPRVLTLLSGGIDSPVAAYMIMKRGSATDYVTFHSSPYTPQETVDKVEAIAALLNTFQTKGTLHVVNLLPFQKLVRDCCSERMRTVLYRRAMFRIAEKIAHKTNCRALVTGEALGQVASQTVVNLDTINRATDMLVLRPLIGEDKLDTIAIAEKIGSMELSSVQVPDSCTVFSPSSPSTSVPAGLAEKEEEKIPEYAKVIDDIVSAAEAITPQDGWNIK